MSRNRIVEHLETPAVEPQVPAIPPGFVYCPNPHASAAHQPMTAASFMHQAAYQQALQEARDRAWRAFLDRALFSVWN
jgi:hypothetical protein